MFLDGEAELRACLAAALDPGEAPDVVCFGIRAPRGLRGLAEASIHVLSGIAGEGASPEDGAILATTAGSLLVARAARAAVPLGPARWELRGPVERHPWPEVRGLGVIVERPDDAHILVELPLGGKPRRYLIWGGVARLPGNLAAGRALAAALQRAAG